MENKKNMITDLEIMARIIMKNKKEIIDRGTMSFKFLKSNPIGIALKSTGMFGLLIEDDKPYWLYRIFIDDKKLYLSKFPIGGIITPEFDINKYNDRCYFEEDTLIKVLYFDDIVGEI